MASEHESQRSSPSDQQTFPSAGDPGRASNLSALLAAFAVTTLDQLGDILSDDRDLDVVVRPAVDGDLDGVEILVHDRGCILTFPIDPEELVQVADELDEEVCAKMEADDAS